jgi:prophage antirepressor-like protein
MESIFNTLDNNYINYGGNKISIIIDNNEELWFHGRETALTLGYKDTNDAIKKHVDKNDLIRLNKMNSDNKKGHPLTIYINEAGLYSLVFSSKLKIGKNFKFWVTHDVLPAIRKYGFYRLKRECQKEKDELMTKLQNITKKYETIKKDLTKEKFPKGAMIYFVDYSTDNEEIYRLGMTTDMNKRKQLYNTHTLHKRDVVVMKDSNDPKRLETCLRIMLYDYRYQNNRDYFICKLSIIKKALKKCIHGINEMKNLKFNTGSKTNQKGGTDQKYLKSLVLNEIHNVKKQISLHKKKINKLNIKLYDE